MLRRLLLTSALTLLALPALARENLSLIHILQLPDVLQELHPRHHLPGIAGEIGDQFKLLGADGNMGAPHMHRARLQPDFQIAKGQQVIVQHLDGAPAQQGAQAGTQLFRLKRLGQVIIRPLLQLSLIHI